jgi:hypothetical protein
MKALIASLILILTVPCFATRAVHVRGSRTRRGQYRHPHYRTAPNRTQRDNWSAKGNINPYTGKRGHHIPHR